MSQLRLNYLSLGVSDVVASERFYGETLGLATQRIGEHLEVRWNDGFLLTLTPSPPAGRAKFHFGFRAGSSEEVEVLAARLRDRGVEIVIGPSTENGRTQLIFIDPDEYKIEIYSEN